MKVCSRCIHAYKELDDTYFCIKWCMHNLPALDGCTDFEGANMPNEPTEAEEAGYEYLSLVNSAHRVIEKKNELEDDIVVQVISELLTFKNSHLVAKYLADNNPIGANALRSELNIYTHKKETK